MNRRINVYLANQGRYNEGVLVGTWLKLPCDKDKLQTVLTTIGINEQYEEFFICDYQCLLSNLHINEYSSLDDLNELAKRIEELTDYDFEKLGAVLECESNTSIAEILELIDDLDSFDLLAEVDTDEALGEYYADIGCIFQNIPDSIQQYFDYEAYGRDIRLELNCCFTTYGLVVDNR